MAVHDLRSQIHWSMALGAMLLFLGLGCTQVSAPGPGPGAGSAAPDPGGPGGPSPSGSADILSLGFYAADNPGLLSKDWMASPEGSPPTLFRISELPRDLDLSSLVARYELSPGAKAFVAGVGQAPGTTSNDFRSALSLTVRAENGAEKCYLILAEAEAPPTLDFVEASASPAILGQATAGAELVLKASLKANGGAASARVTVDPSPLGGPSSVDLEPLGGEAYQATFTVPRDLAPGLYDLRFSGADPELGLEAKASARLEIVEPAFPGADFEASGPPGLAPGASLEAGEAYEGKAALRYSATASASALVALSSARFQGLSGKTKLVFWFKGRVSGPAPGLRLQLGAGASNRCYFDLNSIVEGETLSLSPTSGGSYSTKPIDVAAWTKVVLDLKDLKPSASLGDTLSNYVFQFRVRAGGVHDWSLDFVHFE